MATNQVNERVKPLVLTDNDTGEKYTLEFSRESVKFAEARGFNLDDVAKLPMTKIPELFFYAFRMHHKNIARERTDRILFEDMGGMPDGMLERLGMLYSAPFEALANATAEDGEPKNAKVTVEF
jgi:hypothetical protein